MTTRFLPSDASLRRTSERLLGRRGFERFLRQQQEHRRELERRGFKQELSPEALRVTRRLARTTARATAPSRPPLATIALNRLAFGPTTEALAHFENLGGNNDTRLANWVDEQLDPQSIDDGACDDRIEAAGYQTLEKSYNQLWNDYQLRTDELGYTEGYRPFTETELVTFLRALASKRQLFELTVRFWHDHFNVHGEDAGPIFAHYDRAVIRTHALGNFRTLLGKVTKHPVMLEYLNNNVNSYEPDLENDGLNENFARELLELHTLGAESFFGNQSPGSIPKYGDGTAHGYTDADVTMAARCLTGWTYRSVPWDPEIGNNGRFLAHAPWHDDVNNKRVLGKNITSRDVLQDGEDLLDLLAGHRATARFIATKLCRRLVSDRPSEELIETAATVFRNHVDSSDQIARVIRVIALSDEFKTTWGEKIKRPFEVFISALRAGDSQHRFAHNEHDLGMIWWFYLTGNMPFAWHPPNGYPDVKEAWTASSPRVLGWHMVNWMTDDYEPPWPGPYYLDVVGGTPASRNTPTKVVDYWISRVFGHELPPAERTLFIEFFRQDLGPDQEFQWQDSWTYPPRLRGLVGLMFMSPQFSYL